MNHKLASSMKMWKGNRNATILFSLKGLEILHQEGRGQVKTIIMEHLNSILFQKSRPTNKQFNNHLLAVLQYFPSHVASKHALSLFSTQFIALTDMQN
jgi:hypothetical protein